MKFVKEKMPKRINSRRMTEKLWRRRKRRWRTEVG